ncbi:TAT-variant-translocated molybdopterin oxidoreductase [Arachidicoccus soli]|uniref:4Fe-4S dicluster domain-containing protein n=1 Tax=Arachidicoccus soli TaxID=2341117 RepID=A0A386HKQ0_9BACT|nr:TAT-variant-translocated molybdopterin oxidoreductase [Arachidicoccus soli]AYD46232.1 4Fe-4S dicluster domain-containing protein [Arachidicoccus soli]
MANKKHWQSFGERENTKGFQEANKNEFPEELLPFEEIDGGFLSAPTPRRDFLKYLGFGTAAATLAASCKTPVMKVIPFANKPEDIVPGVANYYATTYVQDGDVLSMLAKVRDGRPIKLEGNELSPISKGGTSARAQASVIELYNTARLRYPTISGKEVTFESIDNSIGSVLAGPAVILTTTVNSPSTLEAINKFIAKYPGSRHVMYDAVSYSGILEANNLCYGKKAIPSYHFENAKVVVGIGADFLGTWISPVEHTAQYTVNRKINEKNPSMSKHFQFESILTPTGASSDERFTHLPSQTGAVVAALLSAVNGQSISGISDAKLSAGIAKVAKDLIANKGQSLVVCGSNDKNIQVLVNAINEAIGANGKTIDWSVLNNTRQGTDADFVQLLSDMNAGSVNTLLVYGANPAYSWYDADKFVSALKKVKTTISFAEKNDETTQLCKYVIPSHNFLESWGDAEGRTGYFSFMQPTINPLFKTRQWQDSLLKWAGEPTDYETFLKNYWLTKVGGETGWMKTLQAGVINPATEPVMTAATFNSGAVAAALSSNNTKAGDIELVLYQKVAIGEGQGASNPFLQEMPDPISRATWDNYIMISPSLALSLLGINLHNEGDADKYETHPAKPVVKLTVNGKSMELPILVIPGTHPKTLGIALGYGRTGKIGKAADGYGKNAFPLAQFTGDAVLFEQHDVKIEKTGKTYKVAQTQIQSRYDSFMGGKRTEILKELTLPAFVEDPKEILRDREEELKPYGGIENFEKQGTIYPYYDKPGIHWGMSIDLNSCTGCGACVVACNIENNIPIVGKDEVARFHDMHWLRIDRYYSGDIDNPNVIFQPMLCQHCDNAPCENVCPVNATNHSTEGLNQMAYNRCIGTRYCANNCPFKVRRFNWADYTGADSFPNNQDQQVVGKLDASVHDRNEELSRMVLNPDVTVRSRGVMEKCSFCVQRLQDGKLKAKKESRPLKSGENNEWDVKTACQQACAGDCIVFGNANDSKSAVSLMRKENPLRLFHSLEQLHVMPNVNYLAKVRNTDVKEPEELTA